MHNVNSLENMLAYLMQERTYLEDEWSRVLQLVQASRSIYNTNGRATSEILSRYRNNSSRYGSIKSIYDSKGATNSYLLASYLHSSLSNPHEKWMNFLPASVIKLSDGYISDDDIALLQDLATLGEQCSLEWQASNFHQAAFPFYKSLVDLGTACLVKNTVKRQQYGRSSLVFSNRSMFNVYFEEDAYGFPSTVQCVYPMTALQLAQYFDVRTEQAFIDLFGESIYADLKRSDPATYSLVHAVYPKTPNSLSSFVSAFYIYGKRKSQVKTWDYLNSYNPYGNSAQTDSRIKKQFIKIEELDSNPYIITRIRKESGEKYGSGISMEAYPLLLQIQQIQRSLAIATQKNTEPALNIPSNRLRRRYSTIPNHLNPVDVIGNTVVNVTPTLKEININNPIVLKDSVSLAVDKIYMLDKINIESVKYNRTAEEVQKRSGEELKTLSPFLGSLETEFLKPLVTATIKHLEEVGGNEIKDIISGVKEDGFNVKYISDIARAQQKASTQEIVEMMSILDKAASRDQKVGATIDINVLAQKVVMNYGVGFDAIRQSQARDQLLQGSKQDKDMADLNVNADATKKLSEAYKSTSEAQNLRLA